MKRAPDSCTGPYPLLSGLRPLRCIVESADNHLDWPHDREILVADESWETRQAGRVGRAEGALRSRRNHCPPTCIGPNPKSLGPRSSCAVRCRVESSVYHSLSGNRTQHVYDSHSGCAAHCADEGMRVTLGKRRSNSPQRSSVQRGHRTIGLRRMGPDTTSAVTVQRPSASSGGSVIGSFRLRKSLMINYDGV